MSVELHTDDGEADPSSAHEMAVGAASPDLRRPNVSGDLPTVFQAAPMFRRAVAGYDRFQVDTYVRWAEDELALAAREREHLLARHLRTRAALEESRQLLSHSSGGREFLQVSPRLAAMLAAAADQADSMRDQADSMRAEADSMRAEAEAEARRLVATAATAAEEMTAAAARIVDDAEQQGREARAEAEARLAKVRTIEARATEHAGQIRQQAEAEAAALRRQALDEISGARLQARAEIVAMLADGREERRRADAAATALRGRLDRDAATRSAALLAEVTALEHRRSLLRAEMDGPAVPVAGPDEDRPGALVRRLFERLGRRSHVLRTP